MLAPSHALGPVMRLASIALVLSACHGGAANPGPAPEPGTTHATRAAEKPSIPTSQPRAAAGGAAHRAGGSADSAAGDAAASAPASGAANGAAATGAAATAAAAETPAPLAGANFIDDAKLLFRVAACGDAESPLPGALAASDPGAAAKLDKI